jgi:hypothetical protein
LPVSFVFELVRSMAVVTCENICREVPDMRYAYVRPSEDADAYMEGSLSRESCSPHVATFELAAVAFASILTRVVQPDIRNTRKEHCL